MSEQRPSASHLPSKPNLRHLKDQAKDRLANGDAAVSSDGALSGRPTLWVPKLAEAERPRARTTIRGKPERSNQFR